MKNKFDSVKITGFNENGSIGTSYAGNPLFWVGLAVLACLIFLTIITMLDFKKDSYWIKRAPGSFQKESYQQQF